MGNMTYSEPKYIDTACDVLSDIMMTQASSQYGGLTIPEIDKLLAPYVEKSYHYHYERLLDSISKIVDEPCVITEELEKEALELTKRDLEQGLQGFEMKFNSVSSSRGDYPFLTFSFGEDVQNPYSVMVAEAILKVRKEGQGKEGRKTPVVFPKLVFLYVEDYHGKGKEFEYLFDLAIDCSAKCMYPDYLSLTGEGYVASIYKKYKKVISPMGCRAWLSPWFKRGGIKPADEQDEPVFIGRFNIGAVSLNLPMIYQKAKVEGRDFYEVLDYYLELIRGIHKRTYEYLGEQKASTNPLAYMYGGFLGGNLRANDKIKPVLKSATASFGITALNELQQLHNGKSLVEDGKFCIEVMEYINKKVEQFKEEDGRLYAIYGTPAENLCGLQVKQFKAKYGEIKNVSDRTYVSNSFHCHVSENLTPVEKQDLENRFWDLFNGGKIQYVKYPIGYNKAAIKAMVTRAMKLGFYEGVNKALSICNNCGHDEEGMDICPVCGSADLTKVERMNGYLSYTRINGDTRLSDHKMDEISDRVSM